MANFKKVLAAVLSAAMVFTLAPAGVATTVQAATKATAGTSTLKVSATKATIKVGKTKTIKVTVNKAQAANLKVSLKSSKATVAKVASKTTIKKGAKTATFKITAKKAGSAKITVSYKTSANKTVKKTIKVTVNNSETNADDVVVTDGQITIEDISGLQTDGTALLNDTLHVSIPQKLGTMADIIWYCDDKALSTTSLVATNTTVTATVAGKYYAVAISSKGTTYKSNTITVTTDESAAILKGFAIEDDYSVAGNLVAAASDTRAVVTVTLNKAYEGEIALHKKSDTKFVNNVGTNVATGRQVWNAAGTAWTAGAATGASAKQTTAAVIREFTTTGNPVAWFNSDGSITYAFVRTLDRGTEYTVTFDQTSIDTDSPVSGKANVYESAIACPYVKEVKSVAVTSVANLANPEATFYDADGKPVTWLSATANTALPGAGFTTIEFFKSTSKKNTGGDKIAAAEAGVLRAGTFKSSNPADGTAYWYVEATTTAGVFGKDSVKLVSEVKDLAQTAASSIKLVEDSTTATSAVVKFTNLRCAGKVYIVRGVDAATGVTAKSISDCMRDFKADDSTTYVTSMEVAAGVPSVTVAGAISKYEVGTNKNHYGAVFVPDDLVNYGVVATAVNTLNTNTNENATDGSWGLEISQVETTYKVSGTGSSSGTTNTDKTYTVKANDQFGTDMGNAANLAAISLTPSQSMPVSYDALSAANKVSLEWTGGTATVNFGGTFGTDVVAGNKFTVKIKNSTFTVEAKSDGCFSVSVA